MKITVLTVFPDSFNSFLQMPVIKRAIDRKICEIEIVDIKHYADGCFRKIDDSPFGGGVGMILRCQPIVDALHEKAFTNSLKIMLSPKGKQYNQMQARELSTAEHIVLLCGHYEGIDARVEKYFDRQISIGDYILTGGEIAAEVIIDSIVRLLKGVLRDSVTVDESYENGLLEYPQYTRPAVFNGDKVPDILLSGNHKRIEDWRYEKSVELTKQLRPDLFERYVASKENK